jgi:hypothetical protein
MSAAAAIDQFPGSYQAATPVSAATHQFPGCCRQGVAAQQLQTCMPDRQVGLRATVPCTIIDVTAAPRTGGLAAAPTDATATTTTTPAAASAGPLLPHALSNAQHAGLPVLVGTASCHALQHRHQLRYSWLFKPLRQKDAQLLNGARPCAT